MMRSFWFLLVCYAAFSALLLVGWDHPLPVANRAILDMARVEVVTRSPANGNTVNVRFINGVSQLVPNSFKPALLSELAELTKASNPSAWVAINDTMAINLDATCFVFDNTNTNTTLGLYESGQGLSLTGAERSNLLAKARGGLRHVTTNQ